MSDKIRVNDSCGNGALRAEFHLMFLRGLVVPLQAALAQIRMQRANRQASYASITNDRHSGYAVVWVAVLALSFTWMLGSWASVVLLLVVLRKQFLIRIHLP